MPSSIVSLPVIGQRTDQWIGNRVDCESNADSDTGIGRGQAQYLRVVEKYKHVESGILNALRRLSYAIADLDTASQRRFIAYHGMRLHRTMICVTLHRINRSAIF